MTRLTEIGLVNLVWSEDPACDDVYAEGLQTYEIDDKNELAIFHGTKCVKIVECTDFEHAVSVVFASEAVCRWNIKQGGDGHGHKVNEKGWRVT